MMSAGKWKEVKKGREYAGKKGKGKHHQQERETLAGKGKG